MLQVPWNRNDGDCGIGRDVAGVTTIFGRHSIQIEGFVASEVDGCPPGFANHRYRGREFELVRERVLSLLVPKPNATELHPAVAMPLNAHPQRSRATEQFTNHSAVVLGDATPCTLGYNAGSWC